MIIKNKIRYKKIYYDIKNPCGAMEARFPSKEKVAGSSPAWGIYFELL
jgi:hypothetical protein